MHYEKCLSLSVSVVFIAYGTYKQHINNPKCFRDGRIYVPGLQKNGFKTDEKLKTVFCVGLINRCGK